MTGDRGHLEEDQEGRTPNPKPPTSNPKRRTPNPKRRPQNLTLNLTLSRNLTLNLTLTLTPQLQPLTQVGTKGRGYLEEGQEVLQRVRVEGGRFVDLKKG